MFRQEPRTSKAEVRATRFNELHVVDVATPYASATRGGEGHVNPVNVNWVMASERSATL